MIDMWSRFTISVIINRKRPRDVVDTICKSWIAYFGTPAAVLNDKGEELTGSEGGQDEINVQHEGYDQS